MKASAGMRADAARVQGALAMLRHAHDNPGVTRAEAAARLGMSSGSASEVVGRLRGARLLAEQPLPQPAGRGRPTALLTAHPDGPLVAVAEINYEAWRVGTSAVGGALTAGPAHHHTGQDAATILAAIRRAITALRRRHGRRLRAVGVCVTGTVHEGLLRQAATLHWHDVDLGLLAAPGLPLVVGNDATLAGVAEARRGAARDRRVLLHLTVQVGVGGILVIDGAPASGAGGAAGEYGHMPFGDPALRCDCGTRGCWDMMVDGRAMARHLHQPPPADPRTFAANVLSAARCGDHAARTAVATVATALGHGIGALINATDPDIVTLGDLGAELLDAAPDPLLAAVANATMTWRRSQLPPIVPAALTTDGPAIGAAEAAWATLLTEEHIAAALHRSPATHHQPAT
ncbi:ROK family protein [Micromonospora sp. NPDC048830]|uniref:ROK family transcriptional regulator n=1 Tax=Micromonospora sp. NPDC048830 TaxID=3364257 RepID=UPI0037134A27